MSRRRPLAIAALLVPACVCTVGCVTGEYHARQAYRRVDRELHHQHPDACEQDACEQNGIANGHAVIDRGSPEWWAGQADQPVGARQREVHGKMYPPMPRPVGKELQASHKFHAAHYWPHPYVCQDRAYVRDLMELQVSRGWERETTLYDYHFDEAELSGAGRKHLIWIMTHVPEHRRHVYVQSSFDRVMNEKRLGEVRLALADMSLDGNIPAVGLRLDTAPGRPAEEVDQIRRLELDMQPSPHVLPENAVTVSGGAGGGGGGAPPANQ